MKYDEVTARDLTYRLRYLDMDGASKTVEGMIEEIQSLKDALQSLVHQCEEDKWPLTASQMMPLAQARKALARVITT